MSGTAKQLKRSHAKITTLIMFLRTLFAQKPLNERALKKKYFKILVFTVTFPLT